MSRLLHYAKKAVSMPPNELIKKIYLKISAKFKDASQEAKDLKYGTHIKFNAPLIKNSYVCAESLDVSNLNKEVAQYLCEKFCEHKFDLLGSGWVKNSYDANALGLHGCRFEMNAKPPKSVTSGYEPIDWQKDFKSGYRWDEKKWYKRQRIGHKEGSDIKVPWELARMQHLVQMAVFSIALPGLARQNLKEFKYQFLDFFENNPPRMGVNWVCTMDVGIRAANLLVAYDIFSQLDKFGILDDEFRQIFANSIFEHGLHIQSNLEFSEQLTSNHYLSDVAGLLFIGAYLDAPKADKWLAFGVQEIVSEMRKEFYEDGGNFESSTSYHRLSAEIMAHSVAIILGLSEQKVQTLKNCDEKGWKFKPRLRKFSEQEFKIKESQIVLPQWFINRLYRAARFSLDITKPNGKVPQFGDNDSGRFFKFSPAGEFLTNNKAVEKYANLENFMRDEELFWDEEILDHGSLLGCFGGLFEDKIFENKFSLEKSFIRSLAKRNLPVLDTAYVRIEAKECDTSDLGYQKMTEYDTNINLSELKFIAYPQSGIYIFKAFNFHLAICATPLGQNDHGGHTHNDELGYELYIGGKDVAKDPGTYLYTPFASMRNKFRSVKAHNVPIVADLEQNDFSEGGIGLFGMFKQSECFITDFGSDFIELLLEYKGVKILRKFVISEKKLQIIDKANKEFYYAKFDMYSNGYGKLMHVSKKYKV